VHFDSGQTTALIPLTILSNNFVEPSRTFTVDLTGVVDTLGPPATFAAQQPFATGSNPLSVAASDVNGDGRPDLLVANSSSDTGVGVAEHDGARAPPHPASPPQQTFATGSNPYSVAASDVNGDGRPDLLVANVSSDTVSVLLNTTAPGAATPSFAARQTFATGSNPFSVAASDVNGDGRPDLLTANYSPPTRCRCC